MGKDLLFENSFKHFANNKRQTNGPEYVWVCCAGCFCHWGNNGVAPVIRDLGGLEGEVKHAGECRGYLGTQSFKGFGKEPIQRASIKLGINCIRWGSI